jgi:hypothetical protein
MLAKGFLPVNLTQPGLRVQNIISPASHSLWLGWCKQHTCASEASAVQACKPTSPTCFRCFAEMLAKGFLPVNLNQPGLRVQNIDPPVLTVEQFLPDEVCDALREAAKSSGKMKVSGVGGTGDLKDDIRTSSTLAITKEVRREAAAVYGSACGAGMTSMNDEACTL